MTISELSFACCEFDLLVYYLSTTRSRHLVVLR